MAKFEKISFTKLAMPGMVPSGGMGTPIPGMDTGIGSASEGGAQSLERSLATLARSAVQERAPELLDKELGFQLMDKNEEGDRIFGILAFQLGRRIVYVPVFFIDGEIKGTEVLYVTKTDLCVPLKEKWVHQLSRQKMHDLGVDVDRDEIRRGQRSPDLYSLIESPQKYASLQEYIKSDIPNIKRAFAAKSSRPTPDNVLLEAVETLGVKVLKPLYKIAETWPPFYRYLDKFYGEKFAAAVKEAPKRFISSGLLTGRIRPVTVKRGSLLSAVVDSKPKLNVIYYRDLKDNIKRGNLIARELRDSLTDEEKIRLRNDGFLIKDARDDSEVSRVYEVTVSKSLKNPNTVGIYDIVLESGETAPAIVIPDCLDLEGTNKKDKSPTYLSVIPIDESNGKALGWARFKPCHVWVLENADGARPRKEGGNARWRKFLDKLTPASRWPKSSDGSASQSNNKILAFLGKNEDAFGPVALCCDNGSISIAGGSQHSFSTAFIDGADFEFDYVDSYCYPEDLRDESKVLYLGDGIKSDEPYVRSAEIFIPSEWRVLSIPFKKARDVVVSSYRRYRVNGQIKWPKDLPLPVISPSAIERKLYEHTDLLKIYGDDGRIRINDGHMESEKDAVINLVKNYGLREKVARRLMKEAKAKSHAGEHVTYRIKYAAPFNAGEGPVMPPIPDPREGPSSVISENLPTQYAEERVLGVTDALTDDRLAQDVYRYDPDELNPSLVRAIQEAAQSGQKELFEANVLATIINATSDDTIITRYLGDLVRGMDRCGRILLTLYWRNKYFEERYGRESIPELEDGLRNNFDTLGDLVLLLKTRDVSLLDNDDLIDDISGVEE